jgi:hypothetical protein
MNVEWGVDLPREIRAALEPYVMRYLDILPPWCHTLFVCAEKDPKEKAETYASMKTDYRYRRARMVITPVFLEGTDEEREQTIIHEFVHVLNAPMVDFNDQLIELVKQNDPDLSKLLETLQEGGMEAATEDTCMVLWRLTADRRHPDMDPRFA